MRFLKLSLLLLITAVAHAAEEEAAPAEGAGVMKPIPKEEREFYSKTQRLNSLATRISEDDKQFTGLVRAKEDEKKQEEKERIIKQMVEVTKDRNKAADEYNKVKSELELRYPNEGQHLNRQYHTQAKKSVEEMEGVAGLDELLSRTKKIIDKKYAPFMPPDEKEKGKAKIAKPEASEKPEPLRLEK